MMKEMLLKSGLIVVGVLGAVTIVERLEKAGLKKKRTYETSKEMD